jgi:DNA-binding FrmR family transcriptional regulator
MENHSKKIITGLKKSRTHLTKVIKMLEENEYCIDILQQNLAVIGLLKSANNKILERHLHSCFATVMQSTNEKKKQKMIEEILQIMRIK